MATPSSNATSVAKKVNPSFKGRACVGRLYRMSSVELPAFPFMLYHTIPVFSPLLSRLDSVCRISGDKEIQEPPLLKTGTEGKTVVLSAGKDTNAPLKAIVSHRLLLFLCHAE